MFKVKYSISVDTILEKKKKIFGLKIWYCEDFILSTILVNHKFIHL